MCKNNSARACLISAIFVALALALAGTWSRADEDDDVKSTPSAKDQPAPTQVTLTSEAVQHYGITTEVARRQKVIRHVLAPAEVAFNADATAVVGCPVQGRITAVRATIGDVVKVGDELLLVESRELAEAQSDYLQKRAALIASEAAVAPLKSSYDRASSLYNRNQSVALAEVQKREIELTTAQNAVLTARVADQAAASKLRLLGMTTAAIDALVKSDEINPVFTVRAPIAGTVTDRLVTLGELVKPDREKLLVVADLTTLWVLANVPESRLKEVKKGAAATIHIGDQTIQGSVSNIGVSIDPATRAGLVRVSVKGSPELKPGMFAKAEIAAGSSGESLTVPATAIQTLDSKPAVFVAVPGTTNTFARRLVEVGEVDDANATILSGLQEGERVVTTGSFIIKAELGKASAKDND